MLQSSCQGSIRQTGSCVKWLWLCQYHTISLFISVYVCVYVHKYVSSSLGGLQTPAPGIAIKPKTYTHPLSHSLSQGRPSLRFTAELWQTNTNRPSLGGRVWRWDAERTPLCPGVLLWPVCWPAAHEEMLRQNFTELPPSPKTPLHSPRPPTSY